MSYYSQPIPELTGALNRAINEDHYPQFGRILDASRPYPEVLDSGLLVATERASIRMVKDLLNAGANATAHDYGAIKTANFFSQIEGPKQILYRTILDSLIKSL